jgi:hypothetical protein
MKNVVQRMIAAILLHIFLWREVYKHAAFLHCEMLRHTARVLMLPMCTIVQKCMKALYIFIQEIPLFSYSYWTQTFKKITLEKDSWLNVQVRNLSQSTVVQDYSDTDEGILSLK